VTIVGAGGVVIRRIRLTRRFERDYGKLDRDLRTRVD